MKVLRQLLMLLLIAGQVSESLANQDILRLNSGVILRYEGSSHLISGIYNGIIMVDLPEVKLPRISQIYCRTGTNARDRRSKRAPLDEIDSAVNASLEMERNESRVLNSSRPVMTWNQMENDLKDGSSGCESALQQKQLRVGISMILGYHKRINRLQWDIMRVVPEDSTEPKKGRNSRSTSYWNLLNPMFMAPKLWDM